MIVCALGVISRVEFVLMVMTFAFLHPLWGEGERAPTEIGKILRITEDTEKQAMQPDQGDNFEIICYQVEIQMKSGKHQGEIVQGNTSSIKGWLAI